MARTTLRFVTFLAPNMYPVYESIVRHIGVRLHRPVELTVGSSYEDLLCAGHAGFLCGLAYVKIRQRDPEALEALAAPLLSGPRYGGRPVYFSDVIVRRDRPWRALVDLRGRSWAYNEPDSHSGYGMVYYTLRQRGHTWSFFGLVVQSGWHEHSIELVREGVVDASAIDSQVLAVARRCDPRLADEVRVIETLGPSTIQPLAAGRRASHGLRSDIKGVLTEMHDDPVARQALAQGFIERFVNVDDKDYDDIRAMAAFH
jgi:phosphonate transport system substrate-binding protein